MTRRTRTVIDLAANLGWPWLVLTYASGDDLLGPRWGPAMAMAAPLLHALWRRVAEGRASPLSVLVVISIALNAAAGFLPLDAAWFAVKEALLPVGFGALFAITAVRGTGLLAELTRELLDPTKVSAALAANGTTARYDAAMRRGTLQFGAVMAATGLLGGGLAAALVRSPTGSEGFAAELGRYTAWSYLVVNLPLLLGSAWVLRGVLLTLEDSAGRPLEELYPD